MAKSQTNAATDASNNLIKQANTMIPPITAGLQSQSTQAQANQQRLLNEAETGFQQQQTTGGYDPVQLANLRGEFQGMLPTGGYDPAQLATLRGNYASMMPTGGYDPAQLASLRGQLASWAPTGGMDPEALKTVTGGYTNLANTGGYTPEMQSQFLNRATSGNRNLQSALASAAQRGAAATGGNAQAAIADIQRQGGQQIAEGTTAAQLGLGQQILQGKQVGLGGLGTTEAQLAAARQGISGQQAGLEAGVAGGARDILSQAGTTEAGVAGGARQIAGLQSGLESGVAQGVQAANVGLSNLFNTQTGQVTALGNQILQSLGLQFGTEEQGAQILQKLSQNPGFLQTMIGDVAQLGGAAAGVMGGVGAMNRGCWIAEAIYGVDDIRTHVLRAYLNGPFEKTLVGRVVMWFYRKFGQSIAAEVRKRKWLKMAFRPIFNHALRSALTWVASTIR